MSEEQPANAKDTSNTEPLRLTSEEWLASAELVRSTPQPVTVHLRSRFWMGLLLGLLLGVAACVAVAVYALGQVT